MTPFTEMDEEELTRRFGQEMTYRVALGEKVCVEFDLTCACSLAAVICAALRDPELEVQLRYDLEQFMQPLSRILNRTPAFAEALRRGNDPAYDGVPNVQLPDGR